MITTEKPKTSATQLVVRVGRHAVLFHINLSCKSVWTVVADHEATTFSDRQDADEMARRHGLCWGQFTIEPKETNDNEPQ